MQWQERQVYATILARTKLKLNILRHTHTQILTDSHLKDLGFYFYICNYDS